MNETTTQANHELLLGLSNDAKNALRELQIISSQLLDLQRLTGDLGRATSPALGLCSPHVAEWLDAGGDPSVAIPAAQTVMALQGIGTLPVCVGHFRVLKAAMSGPQLLVAQPGVPQQTDGGLIVPGR